MIGGSKRQEKAAKKQYGRRAWSGGYGYVTTREMVSARLTIPVSVIVSAEAARHRKWKLDMECWLDKIVKNDGRVEPSTMHPDMDAEVFSVYGEKCYVDAMVRCIETFIEDVMQAGVGDCGVEIAVVVVGGESDAA